MKIAIAGSHGTGKSSLAKGLAEQLRINCICDIVREEVAPKNIFTINTETPFEGQIWLIARQWELEKTTKEPWVADKCLFDYWVYAGDHFKDHIKKTIWAFNKQNTNYDFIFYLPIEFPMEIDGLRSEDEEFRKEIDERYKKLLNDLQVKYTTLPSFINESATKEEAIQKRINLAISYIKS